MVQAFDPYLAGAGDNGGESRKAQASFEKVDRDTPFASRCSWLTGLRFEIKTMVSLEVLHGDALEVLVFEDLGYPLDDVAAEFQIGGDVGVLVSLVDAGADSESNDIAG